MVQVGQSQLPGYGGVTAPKPGYQDSPYQNFPGYNGNGNGNGAAPGTFDPLGDIHIANYFWGFVMVLIGLKS